VVRDTIRVNGVSCIVQEIKLGYTILSDEDEVFITIPNRHIIGEILHNSRDSTLLVLCVGIPYHCDPEQAIQIIRQAIENLPGMSQQRELQIGIDQFGDSSIDIGIRCWVETARLFDSKYRINTAIHQALKANNIEIPFPQRDVHLHQQDSSPV
jgi:small conductance mechanosensitive channel